MEMLDIHQHVVYGIDDGPSTLEASMDMITAAYQQGVSCIFATSHACPAMQPFPRERYERHLYTIYRTCQAQNIPIALYCGCEVFYSEIALQQLQNGLLPSLAGTKNVLIEFDPTLDLCDITDAIRKLSNIGYRVIVAHCERYPAIYRAFDLIQGLQEDYRVGFQMNASTIINHLSWRIKRFRDRMLDEHYVDYIASDAHNCTSRANHMLKAYEAIAKRYGQDYARKILLENQTAIIAP